MSTTEATIDTSDLPDFAPVPRSAMGPALNEHGYFVGRVERNLYSITDGAVDESAAASGASNSAGLRPTIARSC